MRSRAPFGKFLGLLIAGALAGCAGSYKHTLSFNPSEPIRIAVLPFAQVDESGKLTRVDENLLIDNVGLVSSKLKQTPAQFVQTEVQSELSKASLDVVTPGIVEAAFVHNGYTIPDTKPVELDLAKIFAAPPQDICSKLLSCDAVLYGTVTRWDRSYYGVQSVSSVGLKLRLVSAHNNRVLFETTAEDSDSRGITKGPTGFSNLVLEPLKGLDNAIITALADDVVETALKPLNRSSRPEFLSAAPPAIVAAAHTAPEGTIPHGGRLTVIVLGSPSQTASFSIGNRVVEIPLVERSPGHYVGEYIPLPADHFQRQQVFVSLQDEAGRTTRQPISGHGVSYR
jgi:hypothetical protein